jgi:hypothetical protein
MTASRKYVNYSALAEKLKRLKIKKYGKVASFLLDIFVLGNSRIYKDMVEIRDLIPPNKMYSQWRDELVQLGVLNYDYNFDKDNKDKCRFTPGIEIVHLINKEIILKKSLATKEYLSNYITRDEMNQQILEAIKCAIKEMNPPVDDEKIMKVLCAISRNKGE